MTHTDDLWDSTLGRIIEFNPDNLPDDPAISAEVRRRAWRYVRRNLGIPCLVENLTEPFCGTKLELWWLLHDKPLFPPTYGTDALGDMLARTKRYLRLLGWSVEYSRQGKLWTLIPPQTTTPGGV